MIRLYNVEHGKTWEEQKPGWYSFTKQFNTKNQLNDALDCIEWLYSSIDNCERHARWELSNDGLHIKFRYERDYVRFVLVWG